MTIRKLSPELAKKAEDELFEVPSRIQEDLQAIKEWLNKQSHINARLDDQWLIAFLRGCKYSLERTKEKLDMFYTVRSAIPEICMPIDPLDPQIQEILNAGTFLPLPKTVAPDGPRVVLGRFGNIDPAKVPILSHMRANFMLQLIQLLEDDNSVIAGQMYMMDWTGMTLSHIAQMTPTVAKKMTLVMQDSFPVRQKGAHHFNVPSTAETVFGIVKQFLNEKNRNRLFVHKDVDSMLKHIPKSILPAEYGGDAGPIQDIINNWKKKTESYRELFLQEVQYKTDENKRVGKPKTAETLCGIEGSFRQLNVD